MKRFVLSALILLMVLAIGGSVMSQSDKEQVKVTGLAAIMGDKGQARDRALEDAQRKAVEQVVGVMIDAESLVENFQLVNDRIYSQSAGYLCGYKVLNERSDADTYYVTIDACVTTGDIGNDLMSIGICLRRLGNPRTMLMIAEQNVGTEIHGWWEGSDLSIVEQRIMELFNEKGVPLIDPSVAAGNIGRVKAIGGEVDPKEAVRVGKNFNAEHVVLGKALVTCKPKDQYGFYNCYANVNIRIVKVDTGAIFGAANASGKSAHIEEHEAGVRALKKAAEEVAPKLFNAVMKICAPTAKPITVYLTGVKSLGQVKNFANSVSEFRNVKDVNRRNYRRPKAELEIMYAGRTDDLADDIDGLGNAEVTDYTDSTITVQLK